MAKARVVVSPNGLQVNVFVDEGAPEEAKAKLLAFYAALGEAVQFEEVGQPEQHRHDADLAPLCPKARSTARGRGQAGFDRRPGLMHPETSR